MKIRLLAFVAACMCVCALVLTPSAAFAGPKVKFETSLGDFVVELDREKAPKTVANFLKYVNKGFYDNTIFHRVIDGFMVQGGGFTEDMQQKATEAPIENEASNGLSNKKYTIAMARTGSPHSATAQFFINTVDNANLDYRAPTQGGFGYAVFGKVVRGQAVIDKIRAVATGSKNGMKDVPLTTVLIKRAAISN